MSDSAPLVAYFRPAGEPNLLRDELNPLSQRKNWQKSLWRHFVVDSCARCVTELALSRAVNLLSAKPEQSSLLTPVIRQSRRQPLQFLRVELQWLLAVHNRRGDVRCQPRKAQERVEALLAALRNPAYHFKRIGLEAGPLSQWLFSAMAEAELPVICVETRHMRAVLKA